MLKKTISYKDLDGNPVTDDFYFNLSVSELAKLEISAEGKGGYGELLKQIVGTGDGELIINTFEKFIRQSYGKRSEDGKRFMKSPEISDEFMQTDAYDSFFMELILNPEAAAEFIQAIMPADLAEKAEQLREVETRQKTDTTEETDVRPAWIKEDREPTKQELQTMSAEELRDAYARKARG